MLKQDRKHNEYSLDLDDKYTSRLERWLVIIGFTCTVISAVAEVIQVIQGFGIWSG